MGRFQQSLEESRDHHDADLTHTLPLPFRDFQFGRRRIQSFRRCCCPEQGCKVSKKKELRRTKRRKTRTEKRGTKLRRINQGKGRTETRKQKEEKQGQKKEEQS